MPPKKMNGTGMPIEDAPPSRSTPLDDGLGVEDLNLPKSMVQRLAKGVLPPNTQIQKDALLAMSKSATVFVNYITSCAAEHALRSGKKTLMPKDVFDAMTELELEFMLPRLEAEVTKFTSIQADKRNTYRKKVREEKKAVGPKDEDTSVISNGNLAEERDGEPAAKKARRGSVGADHQSGSDMEDNEDTVDVEDEEVEDDEIEEEVVEEGLTEDPLEEREEKEEDEEIGDGDESD